MVKKMDAPDPDHEMGATCPRCTFMFSGQHIVEPGGPAIPQLAWPPPTHHPSVSSFEGAVRSGCVICCRLWRKLQKAGYGDLGVFDEDPVFSVWILFRREDGEFNLTIMVVYPNSASSAHDGITQPWFTLSQSVIFSESRLNIHESPLGERGVDRFPSLEYRGPTTRMLDVCGTSTSSQASWARATSSYTQCRNHHETCNAKRGRSSFLPTRILDLSSNDKQIRLVAGEKGVCHDYATLSHRWGGSDIIRLRMDNMAQFQKGIDINDLPLTFKDAIEVARQLDILYLWIDSLCIIQDDSTDWQAESALMGEVYSNGVLNIMATACENSHQGLYRDRDPRELRHCSFKASWTAIKEKHLIVLDNNLWEDLITRAPLNERGWVLQERILAPRTLHFAENQLAWECRTMEACEMYPDRLPRHLENLESRVKFIDLDTYWQSLSSWTTWDPSNHAGYHVWSDIVRLYSGTQLTKEADRLVAISGLAKRMRSILSDKYLAGLWAGQLPYQLVWHITTLRIDGGTGRRVENYRAPSWTWASVDGEVRIPMIERGANAESLIEIEEAKITPLSGIDDTAEVIDGYIRLKGHLFKAEILGRDTDAGRFGLWIRVDGKLVYGMVYLDEPIRAKHTSVFYLPVYRRNGEICQIPQSKHYSLILKPAEGRPRGWYSRIGVVETWANATHDEAWAYISEQLENPTLREKSLGLEHSPETIILT